MIAATLTKTTFGYVMLSWAAVCAYACEINVRDAAFRAHRDMHRLCVMARADDAAADSIQQNLSAWLNGLGANLNIELVRVDVDDPEIHWSDFGIPSAPPVSPVVVMVGRNWGVGQSFVVSHWEQPGPTTDDLNALATSPAREAVQKDLGRRLAVLLYAPGQEANEEATNKVIDEVRAKWSQSEQLGVSVVHLDRTDPREQILLSFLGIDPAGPDWMGIVFGKGKVVSPPLQGADISAGRINQLIDQLSQDCSCSKPLPSIGVDMPLVWDDALDATVVPTNDLSEEEATAAVVAKVLGGEVRNENSFTGDSSEAMPGPSLVATTFWTIGAIAGAVIAISMAVLWSGRRDQVSKSQ